MIHSPTRPADLSSWLKNLFIPVWIERTCRPGIPGYVEEVSRIDGSPIITDTRSTLVTGRLLYSFSRAHGFDGSPASLQAARHGLTFLIDTCRQSPGHFAHTLAVDARVIDPDADLYDLAFVLLGLAGYAQASGEHSVLHIADEIGDRLDGELEDPFGGYQEPVGSGNRRRQFPQMHLFEAFQLLAALDPSGGWMRRAGRIADLAQHLVHTDGSIDEWYAADWEKLPVAQREREIGHHFEWSWMLRKYSDATRSRQARELSEGLFNFGIATAGIGSTGPGRLIPNAIDAEGRPLNSSRPLWPTTELLRAATVAADGGRLQLYTNIAEASAEATFRYSVDIDSGLWTNDAGGENNNSSELIPTRVLYHLIPSILEYSALNIPTGLTTPTSHSDPAPDGSVDPGPAVSAA